MFLPVTLIAGDNLCNGTEDIKCKITIPQFSTQTKIITKTKETVLSNYYYKNETDARIVENLKDYWTTMAKINFAEELFPSEMDKEKSKVVGLHPRDYKTELVAREILFAKAGYEKLECKIDKLSKLNKASTSPYPQSEEEKKERENKDYVTASATITCSLHAHLPPTLSEIKQSQCTQAQICLSSATTLGELKKLETFRNTICESSDTITSKGDGKREMKPGRVVVDKIEIETKATPK